MRPPEILIWDLWMKRDGEFERLFPILAEDVSAIEEYFDSMRCGTSLILL